MLILLRQAAIESPTVFEVLMDAVRIGSLGQITNALFEVGGSTGGICRPSRHRIRGLEIGHQKPAYNSDCKEKQSILQF